MTQPSDQAMQVAKAICGVENITLVSSQQVRGSYVLVRAATLIDTAMAEAVREALVAVGVELREDGSVMTSDVCWTLLKYAKQQKQQAVREAMEQAAGIAFTKGKHMEDAGCVGAEAIGASIRDELFALAAHRAKMEGKLKPLSEEPCDKWVGGKGEELKMEGSRVDEAQTCLMCGGKHYGLPCPTTKVFSKSIYADDTTIQSLKDENARAMAVIDELMEVLSQVEARLGQHHFIKDNPRSVGKAVKMAIGYKAEFLLENNVEWLEELDNFGDRAHAALATAKAFKEQQVVKRESEIDGIWANQRRRYKRVV